MSHLLLLLEWAGWELLTVVQRTKWRSNGDRNLFCQNELQDSWEKESIHRPAPVRNLFGPPKMGVTEEDFCGRYGFSEFYRVSVSTAGLESFSLRPEKFSKRFSFGGGSVRFVLLWTGPFST